ncbi:MAG: hypothetical protein EAZ68_05160 [Oscillatoriales cyanobacterium]|nr:MAG: hypothetical protein EAZ68_05160 [Oscillatoriales cyanobacterium]
MGNKQGTVGAGFTNHKGQKLLASKTRPSSLSIQMNNLCLFTALMLSGDFLEGVPRLDGK